MKSTVSSSRLYSSCIFFLLNFGQDKAPVSKDRLASVHVLYYLRFSLACQQLSVVVFVQALLLALAQLLVA